MTNQQTLRVLKAMMLSGILLILTGHYVVSYSALPALWGIRGLMLGGGMMAIGLALSLPTKMYLTFLFVKREHNRQISRALHRLARRVIIASRRHIG